MIAHGRNSVSLEDILNNWSESEILAHYLGVFEIPTIINSPLRPDKRPSFGLYSVNGKRIYYTDLATKDRGGLFDLLGALWQCSYNEVLERIYKEMPKRYNISIKVSKPHTVKSIRNHTPVRLECKVRQWRDYDIEYWKDYGITLAALKWAEIHPISYKIIYKNDKRYVFGADKYAYVYIERKEGKVTKKIYQPFNTKGYKWNNNNDGSVIGLWAKMPANGDKIVVCSSLKDALCLYCNTHIPSICLQGEGYGMSETAINELKRRFTNIYILLDNDKAGCFDGKKLAKETGFKYIELPKINNAKDISDLFKTLNNKDKFITIITSLFKS